MLPRRQGNRADEQQLKARASAVEWSLSPRVWPVRSTVPAESSPQLRRLALECAIRKKSKEIRLVSMSRKSVSKRVSISNLVSGSVANHALPLGKS